MQPRFILPSIFFISVLTCHLFSCITGKEYFRSQPDLYKNLPGRLPISFAVVHIDDRYSWLLYELNSSQVSYKKSPLPGAADSVFLSNIKISYRLEEKPGLKAGSDTGNLFIKEKLKGYSPHQLRGRLKIRIPSGGKWLMEIQALDVNSGKRGSYSAFVRKETVFSAQNFEVILPDSAVTNEFIFSKPTGVYIKYDRNKTLKQLRVDYFKKEFPPALPPFSDQKEQRFAYNPDSVFYISGTEKGFPLAVDRKGIYHARADTSVKDGVSFRHFYTDFPEVKTYEKMIESLRYIMTNEEYTAAMNSADKKAAVDKFWIATGGSPERARTLIAGYYTRVKEANIHFSSYLEGWKSDRGMIWIVFGPPKNIYRTAYSETWIYGDERSARSLAFSFTRLSNPFSENDFQLERNQITSRENWYAAVDMWRQGRVHFGK